MTFNNSPLETLAAFAIVFAAGVLSVLGMTRYIDKIRRRDEALLVRGETGGATGSDPVFLRGLLHFPAFAGLVNRLLGSRTWIEAAR